MGNQEYHSREYRVFVESSVVAEKIGKYGHQISESMYHIDDFTIIVKPFVEGGPKSVLEITCQTSHEGEIDGLFKKLDLNYKPIFTAREFIKELKSKKEEPLTA